MMEKAGDGLHFVQDKRARQAGILVKRVPHTITLRTIKLRFPAANAHFSYLPPQLLQQQQSMQSAK